MNFDIFSNIKDIFLSYDWTRFLFWARIISAIISGALIAVIVIIVKKLSFYNKPRHKASEKQEKKIYMAKEPWLAVVKKLESENPADWNLAVMHADSIVDKILQDMGLLGETMGDRIKKLDTSRLASLNDLWEAHKVRNEIAHSPERTVTKHRAVFAISLFEKVLKELGYFEG